MRFSPLTLVQSYLLKVTDKRIISGPFAGLFYIGESLESAYFPKLLGTYEKEIHPHLDRLQDQPFDKAVVIGAGEGYYAVGITKKWKIPVIAYEEKEKGRDLMTRLALINRAQVIIRGKFLPKHRKTETRDLVLIDVEGQEIQLLDRTGFKTWTKATLIVEVHSDAIRSALVQQSVQTHTYQFVPIRHRDVNDYPFIPPLSWLLGRYWRSCIQEWRSESTGWLIFHPKK